ncbi:FAD-dependent oxidoreductase [Legionella cincinnatiensis]|uniref:FAD-dependent oxidoreductase n=1 Tax=Legionella cincinnatiensis TaxID=28085 RepID=UPI000AA9E01E
MVVFIYYCVAYYPVQFKANYDPNSQVEWVMQHLRQIYGTNIPNPMKMKQTHWASDPFTRGRYCYLPSNVD